MLLLVLTLFCTLSSMLSMCSTSPFLFDVSNSKSHVEMIYSFPTTQSSMFLGKLGYFTNLNSSAIWG